MLKQLEQLIENLREDLVIYYVNGCFVIENKSFVEGKMPAIQLQGVGSTLELAIENFIYHSTQISSRKKKPTEDDSDYSWYSSH